jgi:hypothetical protein
MAALSFRDRLLTRRGARAILSPVGILGGVAVAVVAAVAGLPVWAAVLLGVGVWGVNLLRLLPRGRRRERVDPFTLHEPWRRFVQEALQARTRFDQAVDRAPAGPLRDRLRDIAARVHTGVDECWQVARRGEALVEARRGINARDVERKLAQVDRAADDPSAASVVQALEAQRATHQRLGGVIERTQRELRLLDARLDEAVARALELAAHAGTDAGATVGRGAGVAGLGSDVEGVVSEMESLRQALDETTVAAQGGTLPGDLPGELPPGGRA